MNAELDHRPEQDAGSVAVVADADLVDEAAHQVHAAAATIGLTGRDVPSVGSPSAAVDVRTVARGVPMIDLIHSRAIAGAKPGG